jgi:glycosyltransferase involved in cell wall biosynthesis
VRGISVRPPFARVDPIGLPLAARSLGRAAREADQLWVVAATAHYGLAAARSGRPYACWIATSLDAEWAARRPALDPLRRAALAAFGPSLRRYERDVLRGARRVYATSPYTRATVAEAAGLDPAAVDLLPIAVDLERFKPIDDGVWSSALARPTLVFVGRADDPRKNAGMLIEAFAALRRRVPEARLRFVGSPPRATLGPGVETVGVVGDVAEHVRDAAVLVLPSLQEGFGVVAAEAMACGVPVVSTPSGGPEETLSRSSAGRVLDGFSAEELVTVVHELLEHPQQLLEMRRRGRDYVEREHSPQRLERLLADAFADLETNAGS